MEGTSLPTVLTAMNLFRDCTACDRCIFLCNGENLSDFFFHKLTALPVRFDQFTDLSDDRIRIHSGSFTHLSDGCFAHHDFAHRRIQHFELIIHLGQFFLQPGIPAKQI